MSSPLQVRPPGQRYRMHIRKEALKFAAAHMTVFRDGSKERLHGHNYSTEVAIDFRSASLAEMIPFQDLKGVMRRICQSWDEKLLLPACCPFLVIAEARSTAAELEFTLCGKRYVLPRDEVELLPTDNITTETLAAHFCEKLLGELGPGWPLEMGVLRIEVRVDEIPGQGASFIWDLSEHYAPPELL